MRWISLCMVTMALTLTACGKDGDKKQPIGQGRNLDKGSYPNVPQTVFGQWQGQDELDNGIFISPRLYVNQKSLGLEMVCRRGLETATVAFAVEAQVSEDQVQVMESAERSIEIGSGGCTGRLTAGTFSYQLQNDRLVLSLTEKSNLEFNRIR